MAQSWMTWARTAARDASSPSELRPDSLAALTGQDKRTLDAIVACWQLYAVSDRDGQRAALDAVRALLPAMQARMRRIARELIPYALDWTDREALWFSVTGGY
jgi:hypothetical protein